MSTLLIVIVVVIAAVLVYHYMYNNDNMNNSGFWNRINPLRLTPQEASKARGPSAQQREFMKYCEKEAMISVQNCESSKNDCHKLMVNFYNDCLAQTDIFL